MVSGLQDPFKISFWSQTKCCTLFGGWGTKIRKFSIFLYRVRWTLNGRSKCWGLIFLRIICDVRKSSLHVHSLFSCVTLYQLPNLFSSLNDFRSHRKNMISFCFLRFHFFSADVITFQARINVIASSQHFWFASFNPIAHNVVESMVWKCRIRWCWVKISNQMRELILLCDILKRASECHTRPNNKNYRHSNSMRMIQPYSLHIQKKYRIKMEYFDLGQSINESRKKKRK